MEKRYVSRRRVVCCFVVDIAIVLFLIKIKPLHLSVVAYIYSIQ